MLAVADNISSFLVNVVTNLEILWICICLNHRKYVLGVCYHVPSRSSTFVSDLHDVVNAVTVRFPDVPVLLLGDFNYPNIMWSNNGLCLSTFSTESNDFLNLCADFNFTQVVTQPTRVTCSSATVLDLVLTTSRELISSLTYLPGLSDHSLLHFDFVVPVCRSPVQVKRISDYARADFGAINHELGTFLSDYLRNFSERSVEDNWMLFKEKVAFLTNRYVPVRTVRNYTRSPWFNQTLRRLSNRKKKDVPCCQIIRGSQRRASLGSISFCCSSV